MTDDAIPTIRAPHAVADAAAARHVERHGEGGEPTTAAGRRLLADLSRAQRADEAVAMADRHRSAIEAAVLREVRERVEALVDKAGGRCRTPADDLICETHSELLFGGACEDQPVQLLAVLAVLAALEAPQEDPDGR